MAELSWDSFVEALNTNNVPEALLIAMGAMALIIVFGYLRDKESALYKILVLLGVVLGALMVYMVVAIDTGWDKGTMIIVTIGAFALIVRPIRDVNVAAILALIVAVIVYLMLPDLVADVQEPFDFIQAIGDGIPRLVVAIVAGGLVFAILQFIQAVVLLAGKILNAWPFLLVIGVVCIMEAVFHLLGSIPIYDYIATLVSEAKSS